MHTLASKQLTWWCC